jgi:hypothetical protein
MEASMTGSGHTIAVLDALAQFSPSSYYSNMLRGYQYYELLCRLDKDFDTLKDEIIENLQKLVTLIFTKDNCIVSYTADDEGYEKLKKPMEELADRLSDKHFTECRRQFKPKKEKTAYTSSSQVQYVARCGNYAVNGLRYTGALKVLKVIFSYDYLWINVRVKGGAYGCMSSFYRNGDMYMASYRDPNLKETNEIYENAADYLENFTVSDRDMVKFIIGTIGGMDTPMSPSAKGVRSFGAYICHAGYDDLKRERDEVINATQDSIRALAPYIRTAVSQDYLCVVGNSGKIQDNREMFDVINPLFVS